MRVALAIVALVSAGSVSPVAAQDAGPPDAAPPDAGVVLDAGVVMDAGPEPEVAPPAEESVPESPPAQVEPASDVAEEEEAEELEEEEEEEAVDLLQVLRQVHIHGFVSQGFILTVENDYLVNGSQHGSFEFTEVGVNLTTEPIERLRLGMQLFARDLGPIGDYRPRFDWFYADYRFADWFGIRFGRTKLPFGLYNEVNDVDAARIPVLLPQSIYPTTSRDFLLAQTGVELYGLVPLGAGGRLDYRLYAGTVFAEFDSGTGGPFEISDVRWPYLIGGRLMWETPLDGLRAGGSVQVLKLDTVLLFTEYVIETDPMTMMDVVVPNVTTITAAIDPAVLWVASVEYASNDLIIAAEYGRWHVWTESSDPMRIPESQTVSERFYSRVAYQLTPWFRLSLYHSLMFRDVEQRDGRAARQHDVALTLRFDINDYWLVKLEGHYLNGTAALLSTQNGGRPLDELGAHWGLFLLKTTAYF